MMWFPWEPIGRSRDALPMGPRLPPPPSLPDDASLFLDLDGTIVPLAPRPEMIVVDEALRDLLIGLGRRLDGRLAMVSGRALDNLDSHLELPALAAAGSHGLERRGADGQEERAQRTPEVAAASREIDSLAGRCGVVAEHKPAGAAVHYRERPEVEAAVTAEVANIGQRHGLEVQHGSMVRELRLPGGDKGDAVRAFMDEQPFAKGVPIVLGDDLTDESAFEAARGLGGFGILVGDPRQSAARYGLPSVDAVREWLAA